MAKDVATHVPAGSSGVCVVPAGQVLRPFTDCGSGAFSLVATVVRRGNCCVTGEGCVKRDAE
jgi:hypothetical protein